MEGEGDERELWGQRGSNQRGGKWGMEPQCSAGFHVIELREEHHVFLWRGWRWSKRGGIREQVRSATGTGTIDIGERSHAAREELRGSWYLLKIPKCVQMTSACLLAIDGTSIS